MTAPRACPTESAVRASTPTKDSSRTTASGRCSSMSAATASKIVFSRSSGRSAAAVFHHPWSMALRRPSLSWTIPYPQEAVPGSMPMTFTVRGYGPHRTFLAVPPTYSSPHAGGHLAHLSGRDGRWYVEDCGSFNGTFLNGTRVQPGTPLPLRHADRIGIGSETVLFSWPAQLQDPDTTEPLQEVAPGDL